jgi:hypothetical protein
MSYTSYVDSYSDLASVWGKISGSKDSAEYKYWNPKGAVSKADFGRIHWGESGEGEGRALDHTTASKGTSTNTNTNTNTNTDTTTALNPATASPTYDPTPAGEHTNEVMYANNAVAGMPKLGAPPKIADPAQRTVHPQELVEWRMANMMSESNPYTAQAITQAKQWANQSGMLNTSIASSAGIDAAIKNILPIAQQDAATLHGQALANQKVVNEFLMQDFLTKSQFKLTEYGHMANTYNQGLQQAHVKNESAITRAWQGEQNKLDRELNIWRDKLNASMSKELADMGYEFGAEESNKACRGTAMNAWQVLVAKISASQSTISKDDYDSQIYNAKAALNHALSMCG